MAPTPTAKEEDLRLRRQGLRKIELWVPDVRAPEFAAEARRQSRLVSRARHVKSERLGFIECTFDWNDDG